MNKNEIFAEILFEQDHQKLEGYSIQFSYNMPMRFHLIFDFENF